MEICRRLDGIPLAIELSSLTDGVDDRDQIRVTASMTGSGS